MERSIPYLSFTDFVDEYMISAGIDRQKYVANYTVHAMRIFKDLMWGTVWQVKSTYKKVKFENGQYYFDVPADCIRVLNVSRIDSKGREVPFLIDHRINTLAPIPANGMICEKCGGTNDLGACVNNVTVTTKQVYINDQPYIEKIWKRMEADGSLMEVREVPSLDYSDPEEPVIKTVTLYKKLCQLEVKDCGCVVTCEKNEQLVKTFCGSSCTTTKAAMVSCEGWAKIKIRDGRIYFAVKGSIPDFVKFDYQTNGECGLEEIMIPEYMVNAMTFGTHWRAGALAPSNVISPTEKRERERLFEKEKQNLAEFLNPIRPDDFLDAQMLIPKWGGTNIECEIVDVRKHEDILFELSKLGLDMGNCCCLSVDDINKLIDKKIISATPGQGLQGPPGPQGPAGPASEQDLSYHHDQSTPATVWDITHNLGFEPSIEIKNKSGVTMIGWSFDHVTLNRVIVTHSIAVAGDAYLT